MALRIFGSQNSPYSVKIKSYCQYKGISHEWIIRNSDTQEEYSKYAKLPIIPLVVTPKGEAMQDSTPIIEAFEARCPEPSLYPSDPTLRFLSELLEEYGDEWGNKWMFHLRWARAVDQDIVSVRLAREMMPNQPAEQAAKMIKKRMSGRGFAVGSNEKTAPIIEADLLEVLPILEKHLQTRKFLLGNRPALADFGLGPQLYETLIDPTGGDWMKPYPRTCEWCMHMVDLKPPAGNDAGNFEQWEGLQSTLEPLLKHAGLFLAWSVANAEALGAGKQEMTVDFGGKSWWQTVGGPQKYHVKSLKEIRRKYQAVASNTELRSILERTGCLAALQEKEKEKEKSSSSSPSSPSSRL